ncbi:2-oxoglutarate dehydrogenase E1 component [Saprospira grandis]|uniref:2-oxoglutarate dehydrogenase E1 component n=1 Tax=Saprospira grandis TaxID=1008 RepID=UPI0022DDADAC|nr:2-oxoglutarate dehydrogenase E1 component [Saprospira grandis]WBM76034.1 2-oxoglutarate dehydrogenase E1 component [Saprospira grandis]
MSYSFISNAHPGYIDNLYKTYKENPEEVAEGWKQFFAGFDFAIEQGAAGPTDSIEGGLSTSQLQKEFAVLGLIHGYRQRGHLLSTTNPVRPRRFRFPNVDLANYNLTEEDLEQSFMAGAEIGMPNAKLKDIRNRLIEVYCGNIGVEYSHIEHRDKRMWLRDRMEKSQPQKAYDLSISQKRRILEKLNGAVGFENFLAKKYVAQKRFGLEGGETTIPALDAIICKGAEEGVEEVVIGMAHRGRLNVLVNIMGKTYDHIFSEFQNVMPEETFGDGDVKYHLGYASKYPTPSGKEVHMKLVPNPSHLEAVGPVVQGYARAQADVLYTSDFDKILPILIHGDAAVAGQGVVYEVVQMSQLEGYYTGGTIHFVINNQVGFTTDFEDARSSTYCTGAAALVQAPVFHVNGDDPDAVIFAATLAAEYRQKFNTDVFIDMVCYRKHGHNEGDDPKFTQPKLYEFIKNHRDPRSIYLDRLIEQGAIEKEMAEQMDKEFNTFLQERFDRVEQKEVDYTLQAPEVAWSQLQKKTSWEDYLKSPDTAISEEQLTYILNNLQEIPKDFNMLSKFKRILKRSQGYINENKCDWSMAEHLAYGSLLLEGHPVRMSGQDVKRGTFSHRNAVLYDVKTNEQYNRLNHLKEGEQAEFRIFNSLLSEFAVLGFEYGYSLASPDSLVVWEAQFGDFVNGAQTIIDQFITSSESKWARMSGLVMLLPHGYEGQGPEHSSARLERFLQACAEYNMTVANVTTPANFFHLIRRQLARPFRKPLILMSPKSLLRHPSCISDFKDFTAGGFQETFDDASVKDASKIKKVLCCTGRLYYDLLEKKEKEGHDDIAIVRLEQLYPFPQAQVNELIKKYANAKFFWVQEEPSNMGSWQYLLAFYRNYDLGLIARKSSASPATGYKKQHNQELEDILQRAFAPIEELAQSHK